MGVDHSGGDIRVPEEFPRGAEAARGGELVRSLRVAMHSCKVWPIPERNGMPWTP